MNDTRMTTPRRAFAIAAMMGLGLLAGVGDGSKASAGEVEVGAAKVDITPKGPIRLSGYLARSTESVGVAHPIHAAALAIGSDEQKPVVVVTVDNVGISAKIADEVAARIERKAGVTRDRFAVGVSHAHTAPVLTDVIPNIFGKPLPADEQERVDAYTREFTDKLERVALAALADRRPAELSWAKGEVGFAANRRTPGGPVDHSLSVLKATGPDGKIRAILTNYACHCTSIDPGVNQVDGDWAGAAQKAIEEANPGCVALTLVGCGADSNPQPRGPAEMAQNHGRALADEVARLLKGDWKPISGPPETAFERFELPFDTLPTRAELEALVKAGGPPGGNAEIQLARLGRDGKLAEALPYSAQAWRFGDDLLWVFLPGEVVVDYSLRLKKEFDPDRIIVSGYSNDVPAYIPSERILNEGGYEGGGAMIYYAHPARLKPGVEQIIIDAVHRVVGPHFQPPADEAGKADDKAAANDDEHPPALSPGESLKTFRTKPGLRLELVASEPLIESPVAIDFGADGRLWVCEMIDYPAGMDGKYQPGGVIKVLEDRDGDGEYDTAVTFLEGLAFPTGVMAWRNGVLVSAAPEIIYAEDTDGDGKADVRKVLYQGFSTENYQARVNGLSYNQDGWVYGANGLIGGSIRGRADGREVNIGGRDFRFKPDLGIFEPAAGLTQQGRIHDDWGRQFGGNNGTLLQQYPLPDHYVQRNLRVAAPSPTVNSSRGDDDPGQLFPISKTLARYNEPEQANRVTSACGPEIYRDSLLGDEYAGNGFAAEPVHNLVRRVVLDPGGVVLNGHRAADEQTSEFLATTDSWSRPVQVRTGPDGALWVVDMYRFVIEHPRWISPDRLATIDVRAGANMGRIYRLVPEDKPLRAVPNLEKMSTPELAAAIDSPNGVVRDLAQRLLDHRADKAAAPALAKVARESEHPAARAQALSALDVLGALDDASILRALADPHPGVRAQAVRVSESRMAKNAEIGRAVIALAEDPDVAVRYQTALSLGEWPSKEAGEALGAIALRDGADGWLRAAVLSSATPHAEAILASLVAAASSDGPAPRLVEPLIATIAGSGDHQATAAALEAIVAGGEAGRTPQRWRLGAVAQLLDGVRDDSLTEDPAVRSLIAAARELVADADAEPADRVAALRLLGRSAADRDADRDAIADRLDPAEPAPVQSAALKALERIGDEKSADAILERWNQLGPALRAAALDALSAREQLASALIGAIEAGRVEPGQIGAEHRERLLTTGAEALRQRAEAAFGSLKIGARKDVLDAYASVKSMKGDPARGKVVYERVCATCHKVGDQGHEVGPDLAALTDLSADALLTAILDPNQEIDARYVSYNAALKDGRVLSGLISGETASAITLKRQEGVVDEILRDDLEELASSGRSLMPEGLENDLKPEEMADLIAFLSRGASRPKVFAGNEPEEVQGGPEGVVRLTAANAQIYGPSLVFEPEYGNLGYWHSEADRAVWTFKVGFGSTFTVAIDWACDAASAGNRYLLTIGGRQYHGTVPSTGGWSNYKIDNVAFQALHPATHRLELRSDGPIGGALADVRAIILTPGESGPAPALGATQTPADAPKAPESVDDAARAILDPKTPNPDREAILERFADKSAELIAAMAEGLPPGDEEEEYHRIPWIWRVAIAAGKRDDADEMRRILDVSLPANEPDARLDDWRAVVIGGGLINGVSMTGPLPGPRFDEILKDSPELKARWDKSIELAAKMADDEAIRTGTRYDALRMLGVKGWDKHGEHLVRYLAEGIDPELHQGAVCALVDIRSPRIIEPLLECLNRLTPSNRKFAIEGLARDADRREALVSALESGRVDPKDVGEDVRALLVDPDQTRSADRAKKVFAR